jgi:mono/diheme cytochrome c family protein
MCSRILFVTVAVILILVMPLAAQNTPAASPAPAVPQATAPQVRHVPAPYSNPASGKAMYVAYCASCHGVDGRGEGPAAQALKTMPANLTTLALKNGGTFPEAHVAAVIQGDTATPAHGGKDMPVWGPVFRALGQHQSSEAQLRIRNLVKYLESIQQK